MLNQAVAVRAEVGLERLQVPGRLRCGVVAAVAHLLALRIVYWLPADGCLALDKSTAD